MSLRASWCDSPGGLVFFFFDLFVLVFAEEVHVVVLFFVPVEELVLLGYALVLLGLGLTFGRLRAALALVLGEDQLTRIGVCLLYTSPSPRD